MSIIEIQNHGAAIVATNYWESELAREGKMFCSVNAGAIRVLLPSSVYPSLKDMRLAKECVLSRGPWPAERRREAVEIMFDDGSESPYAIYLTPESFDLMPEEPEAGREWILTVWVAKKGKPHRSLERICHWRRVDRIPCLKPWPRTETKQ